MKKILFFILACLCFTGIDTVAQTLEQVSNVPQKETKAERKAREKKLQAIADSVAFIEANNAIDANYFVVTAEKISLGNTGYMYMTPEGSTNFVLVQGEKATVQLAVNNGHLGYNGLGGITVEGTVSGMKKKISKKGDINYSFNVNGVGISAQINILVYKNCNSAVVDVTPNLNSDRMVVYGPIIPYRQNGNNSTTMFKGSTIP